MTTNDEIIYEFWQYVKIIHSKPENYWGKYWRFRFIHLEFYTTCNGWKEKLTPLFVDFSHNIFQWSKFPDKLTNKTIGEKVILPSSGKGHKIMSILLLELMNVSCQFQQSNFIENLMFCLRQIQAETECKRKLTK